MPLTKLKSARMSAIKMIIFHFHGAEHMPMMMPCSFILSPARRCFRRADFRARAAMRITDPRRSAGHTFASLSAAAARYDADDFKATPAIYLSDIITMRGFSMIYAPGRYRRRKRPSDALLLPAFPTGFAARSIRRYFIRRQRIMAMV